MSGERDAHRFLQQKEAATGPDAKSCGAWEGVHQALTRKPGDLPAFWSLLPGSRGWPGHGKPPSERRTVAAGAAGSMLRGRHAPVRAALADRSFACPAHCRMRDIRSPPLAALLLGARGMPVNKTIAVPLLAMSWAGAAHAQSDPADSAPIETEQGEEA